MEDLPKPIKKKINRLIDKAYENELNAEVEKLWISFNEWHEKKIDCFDITEIIHKFHQGPARDLFNWYNAKYKALIVTRALYDGFLKREDIPDDVYPYIETHMESAKDL